MTETVNTQTGNEIAFKIGFTPKAPSLENWPTTGEKFIVDTEVKEYCTFLIKKYRTNLQHSNLEFVFKEKASRTSETITYGTAKAESDLQKTLHGFDAIIIIGHDEWCAQDVDNKLRICLHELEKLSFDDKTGKLKTISPSVMQFPLVIQVFGPSNNSEIEFISAYQKFCRDSGGDGKLI